MIRVLISLLLRCWSYTFLGIFSRKNKNIAAAIVDPLLCSYIRFQRVAFLPGFSCFSLGFGECFKGDPDFFGDRASFIVSLPYTENNSQSTAYIIYEIAHNYTTISKFVLSTLSTKKKKNLHFRLCERMIFNSKMKTWFSEMEKYSAAITHYAILLNPSTTPQRSSVYHRNQ